ncbi:MAG: hypothetical protein ACSHX0_05705 [Akkermansiaceae bacterium]
MNIKTITLLIFSVTALNTLHAETGKPLQMEAKVYLGDLEGTTKLMLSLLFINETEEDQTVLTQPQDIQLLRDAKGLVIQVGFTKQKKVDGHTLIPSIAAMSPVTLRPGEATRVKVVVEKNRTLDSIKKGDAMRVKYVVLDQWGERFQLYHNAIETVAEVTAY